ncbi:hypothetical protein [Aliikangiella maris]|uniref:Uncharacterized protein n=2 Tax=Aliikangiella maris TaxID=3162458 RepID=A0ABV3MJU3_9GAMM
MAKNRKSRMVLSHEAETEQKSITVQHIPRNRVSQNPLLRKGGVHQKSNSAKRSAARRQTKRMVDDGVSFAA